MSTKQSQPKEKQPNSLLTFCGEQDATAFSVVCRAMEDHWMDESGGSRELSVRAENGNIIIGYKKELTI